MGRFDVFRFLGGVVGTGSGYEVARNISRWKIFVLSYGRCRWCCRNVVCSWSDRQCRDAGQDVPVIDSVAFPEA